MSEELKRKHCCFKLLNKAGRDIRVTPKLLREKMEQRLAMQPGDLKHLRDTIKDWIIEWHLADVKRTRELQQETLSSLTRFAKTVGYMR